MATPFYEPPTLINPTTKTVNVTGPQSITFNEDEDGIVQFPNEIVTGRLTINGGRKIWIKGGHITINATEHYVIALNGNNTVFVEGLYLDANGQCDAFVIRNHLLTQMDLTFQNCYVEGVAFETPGVQGGTCHGDIIQVQGPFTGGGHNIKVENFIGDTAGQGFFIPHQNLGTANFEAHNLFIKHDPTTFKQLLWLSSTINSHPFYPALLDNVWVDVAGKTAPWELATLANGQESWPAYTLIDGVVNIGFADGFIPTVYDETTFLANVGLNYDRDFFFAPADENITNAITPTDTVEGINNIPASITDSVTAGAGIVDEYFSPSSLVESITALDSLLVEHILWAGTTPDDDIWSPIDTEENSIWESPHKNI